MSGRARSSSRSPTSRSQTPRGPSRWDERPPIPGQGRSQTPGNLRDSRRDERMRPQTPGRETMWDKHPSGPQQNEPFSLGKTYTNPTVYQNLTRPEQPGNPLVNVGDSYRNIDAIDKLSRYGNITHFFFVAGHSCMTTTSDQPPELIQPVCPNIFFNRPGEPSITRQPNDKIFSYFESYLKGHNPCNGAHVLTASQDAIAKGGFTPGTPISVYLQGGVDLVPNLLLFGPGALFHHQVYTLGSELVPTTNTGCFFMLDIETGDFTDLGSTLYEDTHTKGIVSRDPLSGRCETTAWSYIQKDGSHITLKNVYDVIENIMQCKGRPLGEAALACISCRTSIDGTIRRTHSFTTSAFGAPLPAKYASHGGRRRTKARRNPKKMRKNKRTARRTRNRNTKKK